MDRHGVRVEAQDLVGEPYRQLELASGQGDLGQGPLGEGGVAIEAQRALGARDGRVGLTIGQLDAREQRQQRGMRRLEVYGMFEVVHSQCGFTLLERQHSEHERESEIGGRQLGGSSVQIVRALTVSVRVKPSGRIAEYLRFVLGTLRPRQLMLGDDEGVDEPIAQLGLELDSVRKRKGRRTHEIGRVFAPLLSTDGHSDQETGETDDTDRLQI